MVWFRNSRSLLRFWSLCKGKILHAQHPADTLTGQAFPPALLPRTGWKVSKTMTCGLALKIQVTSLSCLDFFTFLFILRPEIALLSSSECFLPFIYWIYKVVPTLNHTSKDKAEYWSTTSLDSKMHLLNKSTKQCQFCKVIIPVVYRLFCGQHALYTSAHF